MTHLVSTGVEIRGREMTEEWVGGGCQEWGGDGKEGRLIIKVLRAASSMKNWGWERLPGGLRSVFWSPGPRRWRLWESKPSPPCLTLTLTHTPPPVCPTTLAAMSSRPFRPSLSTLFCQIHYWFGSESSARATIASSTRPSFDFPINPGYVAWEVPWSHYWSSGRATTDDSEWNRDRAECSEKLWRCEMSCDSHFAVP